MRAADFHIGMRVRKKGSESCFVPDRNPSFRSRRVGVVAEMPKRGSADRPKLTAAPIRWQAPDGSLSESVEWVPIHRLEAAEPQAAEPPAEPAAELEAMPARSAGIASPAALPTLPSTQAPSP